MFSLRQFSSTVADQGKAPLSDSNRQSFASGDNRSGRHRSDQISDKALFLFVPLILFAGDVAFVLAHVILRLTGSLDTFPMFALYLDGGYPECYQYIKEAFVALALFIVAFRAREFRYLAWSALFCFLLMDDSLGLHELIGADFATGFDLTTHLGLRGQDFGEIAAEVVTGGAILMVTVVCYWLGSVEFRKASRHLFVILTVIIFFGVLVDSLHFLYEINWKVSLIVVVIEDGGEMLGMSLAAWYALRLLQRDGGVQGRLTSVLLSSRG